MANEDLDAALADERKAQARSGFVEKQLAVGERKHRQSAEFWIVVRVEPRRVARCWHRRP
jgi:hypothetical protein